MNFFNDHLTSHIHRVYMESNASLCGLVFCWPLKPSRYNNYGRIPWYDIYNPRDPIFKSLQISIIFKISIIRSSLHLSSQVTTTRICVPAAWWENFSLQNRMVFFPQQKLGALGPIGISSILALMMDGNLGDSLRSLDPHDQKTKLEDCHEAAKITINMVTTEHVYEVLHHLCEKDHIISHQPKFISMMQHINRYCPRTSWISMKTSKRSHTDDNLRCMCFSTSPQLSCSWPSTKSLPYDGQESANHSGWLIGYLKNILYLYWLHSLN